MGNVILNKGRNFNVAFSRGQDAYDAKWKLVDNPYKRGGASWRAWRDGWCAEYQATAKARYAAMRDAVAEDRRSEQLSIAEHAVVCASIAAPTPGFHDILEAIG